MTNIRSDTDTHTQTQKHENTQRHTGTNANYKKTNTIDIFDNEASSVRIPHCKHKTPSTWLCHSEFC